MKLAKALLQAAVKYTQQNTFEVTELHSWSPAIRSFRLTLQLYLLRIGCLVWPSIADASAPLSAIRSATAGECYSRCNRWADGDTAPKYNYLPVIQSSTSRMYSCVQVRKFLITVNVPRWRVHCLLARLTVESLTGESETPKTGLELDFSPEFEYYKFGESRPRFPKPHVRP